METPPPRPIMPARIVEALLVLEHTSREDLVAMGADKRLRALAKTTSTKRQAAAFDRSYDSPKRLAAMSRVVRSPLLGYEFCATLVLAWTDAADAAALAGCCGLARVRTRDKLRWWRSERRRIERAGLPELETTMKTLATSARAMCWTLSRLSAMGRDGVAYEHGRRLKVSETLGYAPARVTTATALCRLAEKAEKPLYGPKNWVGCPPKLVRFAANHFSVRHARCPSGAKPRPVGVPAFERRQSLPSSVAFSSGPLRARGRPRLDAARRLQVLDGRLGLARAALRVHRAPRRRRPLGPRKIRLPRARRGVGRRRARRRREALLLRAAGTRRATRDGVADALPQGQARRVARGGPRRGPAAGLRGLRRQAGLGHGDVPGARDLHALSSPA
mmetsp:Transcript_10550/g.31736  ORF Transcript_10550/g.31736 Transcript_10550/m.31736 type:complete len:390 (-) Transcript_10550:24-1193(-)